MVEHKKMDKRKMDTLISVIIQEYGFDDQIENAQKFAWELWQNMRKV